MLVFALNFMANNMKLLYIKYLWILPVFLGMQMKLFAQDTTKVSTFTPVYKANLNKHDFFVGGTLSLNSKEISNKNALVLNIDDQNSNTISLGIDGGYALKDNFFIGLGVAYGQTTKSGHYTDTDDIQKYTQAYTNKMEFKPFIKNYVPLGPSRRFNIITQTELSFSLQQSISESLVDDEITRTMSKTYVAGIGIRPGISVFVIDNFAIETTVNVAGINYSYQKSETTNQTPTIVKQGLIDLKIDIIQLNLGFFVYF